MTEHEQVVVDIKAEIAKMPQTSRLRVAACADIIRLAVALAGDKGGMAVALVGAELQAKLL